MPFLSFFFCACTFLNITESTERKIPLFHTIHIDISFLFMYSANWSLILFFGMLLMILESLSPLFSISSSFLMIIYIGSIWDDACLFFSYIIQKYVILLKSKSFYICMVTIAKLSNTSEIRFRYFIFQLLAPQQYCFGLAKSY